MLKYALGLEPLTYYRANDAGFPATTLQDVSGSNQLTLSFNGVTSDLTYIVEATSDLNDTWTTLYTFSGPGAPGAVTVSDTQSTSTASKRFIWLRIELP